jgi:hypothetical protein
MKKSLLIKETQENDLKTETVTDAFVGNKAILQRIDVALSETL